MLEWSGMAHTEEDQVLMEQFTWCKLSSDQFSAVLGSSLQHKEQPENILFTYKVGFINPHLLCPTALLLK